MNANAIPSFVSALFLFMLSFISLAYGKREKVNVVFAFFTFSLGLTTFASFVFYNSQSMAGAISWSKLAFVFVIPTILFALYYVLEISDYLYRLDTSFLGISFRNYLLLFVISGIVLEIVNLFTNLIISGVRYYAPGNFEHNYGSLFPLVIFYLLSISIFMVILLYKEYKATRTLSKREMLLFNLLGFGTTFFLFALLRLILPLVQVKTYSLSFVPFTISVVIFILATMRYQFRQITELNTGLEDKVAERTRALRETQAQLVQSSKMAALAELVAGISHELNNPLGVVNSNRGTLQNAVAKIKGLLSNSQIRETNLNQISDIIRILENITDVDQTALERVDEVIKNLKSFAQLDKAELMTANVKKCIESALEILQHEIEGKIKVIKEYLDTPDIYCRARNLNQVFMNVLHNAIQAIKGSGEIKIRTQTLNDFIRIFISDDGCGIPRENLQKIFDPGFTTKGVGVGAGLGLAISYQIIQNHKGRIYVNSEPGKGSTFVIELPVNFMAIIGNNT